MKPITTEGLQATISYLYLMAFCPPEQIWHFRQSSHPLRLSLAKAADMTEGEYFSRVLPEASRRIVAFHQNTQEPDEALSADLAQAARWAHISPESALDFSRLMLKIVDSPAWTDSEFSLRHKHGFELSDSAHRYLFFSLVSKPNYDLLDDLLKAEMKKPEAEQDLVQAMWTFTMAHLWGTLGMKQTFISADHMGNLSYCLLTLSTFKSRRPLPAAQMMAYQEANQTMIQNWGRS